MVSEAGPGSGSICDEKFDAVAGVFVSLLALHKATDEQIYRIHERLDAIEARIEAIESAAAGGGWATMESSTSP